MIQLNTCAQSIKSRFALHFVSDLTFFTCKYFRYFRQDC